MANSPKGYGNLHKNTSGAKNKGSDAFASYGGSIDSYLLLYRISKLKSR